MKNKKRSDVPEAAEPRVLREDQVNPIFRAMRATSSKSMRTRLRNRIFQAFVKFSNRVSLKTVRDESLLEACGGYGLAYEALAKAIDTFDPERGVKFSTYAGKAMQRAIRTECRKVLGWRKRHVPLESIACADDCDGVEHAIEFPVTVDPWKDLKDAQTRIDAIDFIVSKVRLSPHEKMLIMDFMEHGGNLASVARKWGRTRARVQQVWATLRERILKAFQKAYKNDLDSMPRF